MEIQNNHIKTLVNKFLTGQISVAEARELNAWYNQDQDDPVEIPESFELSEERLKVRMLASIRKELDVIPIRSLWPRFAAAAAIVLVVGAGLFFYSVKNRGKDSLVAGAAANVIAPGKTGATLTLADGKRIVLADAVNGALAKESGVVIAKTAEGQLVYGADQDSGKSAVAVRTAALNQLSTARGESYQVRLPDGTRVWLNASSSIKYPASFAGAKNRKIELKGEAYFEVSKDKLHPFIVKTPGQEITVLGTHFNVSSYADELGVKTTLLEGSVKVAVAGNGDSRMLVPGQQALLKGNVLQVAPANLEEAVAWKDGYFRFNDERIESIMRKIARWYNVEVEYRGEITQDGFYGAITRLSSIEQVLEIMSRSKAVHFKIEGRRVIVEN